jgi:hypothetical protein
VSEGTSHLADEVAICFGILGIVMVDDAFNIADVLSVVMVV